MKRLLAIIALLTASLAHAESGTLTFNDFVHNANQDAATVYNGFSFGSAWFRNPANELRDPYLALSTNGGARSVFVERVDHAPFNLDSFNYSGRSNGGVAYLVLYNGASTVFSGTVDNAGRLQFRSPIDLPGGQTFNVAATTGYAGQITGFSFAFRTPGGGFGDGSDSNQFAFDTMKFSNATPVSAVPESSSMLMLLAGLAALTFKAKRTRQDRT